MLRVRLRSWWRSVSRRSELEQGMAEEIRFHIEERADDLMAHEGLPREQALRRARIEFGSVERCKEEARESLGLRLLDELGADLRYAWRTLRGNPVFAAAAIATLAIGIGANAAVFSVVEAVLMQQLPVRDPQELVIFDWLRKPDSMVASYSGYGRPGPAPGVQVRTSFSFLTYQRFREQSRSFASICAYKKLGPVSVVADGFVETASAQVATGGYFDTLGVGAAVGRVFSVADDASDAPPVAVVSYRYWQRRFNGDPAVVGRTVRVNRLPVTIVGVTPDGFHGTHLTESIDVTLPLSLIASLVPEPQPVSSWWVEMLGRLQPGVTREQASAELRGLFHESVRESWAARRADTPNPTRAGLPDLRLIPGGKGGERTRVDATPMLAILSGGVAAVLLIGCVNVVNLLLVRASSRTHELSVRLALGARRGRIVRQLLTENLLLALGGGIAGLLLARWVKDLAFWLVVGAPDDAPPVQAAIDPAVLAFTTVLSLAAAAACGVGPALRATRDANSRTGLAHDHRTAPSRGRTRKALVAAQVALSLTLSAGAGLFARTLHNFSAVDVGFDTRNLLVFRVAGASRQFYEDLIARIDVIPGVQSATVSLVPLVSQSSWTDPVLVGDSNRRGDVHLQVVRANFFDTIQLPLVAGRGFGADDREHSPRVAVVNQTMARDLFGAPNPIGRHFQFVEGPDRGQPIAVVGVVGDAKYSRLQEPVPPTVYMPYTQMPPAPMTFEIRTAVDPLSLIPAVREAAREIDPDLPLMDVQTQQQQIGRTIKTQRSVAAVASLFGAIALLLASIGLYGIVAYDVKRRTSEIGVRVALGASRGDLLRVVLRDTVTMVALGILLGVPAAIAVGRLVERQLFGVRPWDPPTLLATVLVLIAVAAAATFVPARRAAGLDPSQALRCE